MTVSTNRTVVPSALAQVVRQCDANPYAIPKTGQGYFHHAGFATLSRLITCLINEGLATAHWVALSGTPGILFVGPPSFSGQLVPETLVVQLRHRPIVNDVTGVVEFLDPEDLGVWTWRTSSVDLESNKWTGTVATCAFNMMEQIGSWHDLDKSVVSAVCAELESSIDHQEFSYAHAPSPPTLDSSLIAWEQSIIEGHATHPMHRSRCAEPPLPKLRPDAELKHLDLAFVAVPRTCVTIEGPFEDLVAPLIEEGSGEEGAVSESEIAIPVHPMHLPVVLARIPEARVLPMHAHAEAHASLRTVSPDALSTHDIKLPLAVKTSSALRTVSSWSAFLGPRLTRVIDQISNDPRVKSWPVVLGEPASAIYCTPDRDLAKYLACIVRDRPTKALAPNERTAVAAALTERLCDGTSVVVKQWGLNTLEKRQGFLREYTRALFSAFVPPIMAGFAFESHQQNTLVRYDKDSGRVTGFSIRDFGGIMVDLQRFQDTFGVRLEMLDGNSTSAESMGKVYDVGYHTLIQCQLHRLVRALDLHYSGDGWAIVREELERVADSGLLNAWSAPKVNLKSFVRMKFGGLFRDYVYSKVPNILFYQDESNGIVLP